MADGPWSDYAAAAPAQSGPWQDYAQPTRGGSEDSGLSPQQIFQRNAPYLKPGAGDYYTKLAPQDETQFRDWVAKNKVAFNPDDKLPDYDMRGFWKGLQSGDARAKNAVDPNDGKMHYPDYWKTPYDLTFSNESQWANKNAPSWNDKDQLVTPDGKVVFDDRAQPAPEPQRQNPTFQPSGNRSFTPLTELPDDVHGLTVPQAIEFLPVQIYRSMRDFFLGPGQAAQGKMSPDQETEWAANGAMIEAGGGGLTGGFKMGPETIKAVAPTMQDFRDNVRDPSLRKAAAEARPPANTPEGVMAQPEVRDAIASGPVNRDNHVPYEAGASTGTNPTTNIDKSIPEIATLPSGAQFDTATPLKIHEQVEKFVMDKLIAGGMDDAAAYRVGHWEYAEKAEDAWYATQGINPDEAEAWWTERAGQIEHEPTADTPSNLYDKPYPHDSISLASEGPPGTPKPTPEEMTQARQILGKIAPDVGGLFDQLRQARDLGVIDDKPVTPEPETAQTPAEMAFAAHPVGGAVTPDEMKGRFGHAPGSYDVKGQEWANKLEAPEDARNAVADLAKQYDWFGESRAGAPSPKARAAIAEAAGLDPTELDSKLLTAEFNNDGKVRAVIQALRKTSQDFMAAKDAMKINPSEENAAAMLEAQERHRYVLEYTMGARAESGRSLGVWKEALRETERARAAVKLKAGEGTGEVPVGVTDLVNAAGDALRNLKNPEGELGLGKLIKAAEDLVGAQDKAPQTRNRLSGLAKRARAAAKEAEGGKPATGLDVLLNEAKELAGTLPQGPKEAGKPEPQGLASMIKEAQRTLGTQHGATSLIKLAEQAERLAMEMPRSPEEAAAKLPPDLANLIGQARSTLTKLKGAGDGTSLEKLVSQVDRQTKDVLKQKLPRKPVEALPPELQALVDKAERVVDRFGGVAKGEKAAYLLARSGRTAAEQAELARQVEGLTPNQLARVLQRLRGDTRPGWLFWTVQQGLISGLITHTKYAIVNLGQTFIDRVAAPELAAIYGKARGDDVSLLASLRAGVEIFHSVPDALAGFKQAFKTGTRVPLESELRLAERGETNPEAAGALVPYGQPNGPNWGIWKNLFSDEGLDKAARVLGIPGRSANALHTFFKILNERAAAGARAFEMAEKEGVKTGTDDFWQRYQFHLDNPTDEALRRTVEDAYRGTFMEKLGKQSESFAHVVKNTPFKWLIFFTHIPMNMVRRSIEMSPLALLNTLGETRMGAAIKGELGHEAQNLAFGYMTVGTAVGAYFIDKAFEGRVTGNYPTDEKERKRWQALNIQPNSIQANGEWISLDRLGPPAMVARIAANWATVMKNYDGKDEQAPMKAALAVILGTAATLAEEVGFQTIKSLVDIMENPAMAARTAAQQLASVTDPITFAAQGASWHDPYMRRADTYTDALKYRTPIARETLMPKRDPIFGEPVPNPGYHSLLRDTPVADPDPVKAKIKAEMDAAVYFPGPPEKKISGVKLDQKTYDEYEATAGPLVKQLLENYINSPGYDTLPASVKTAQLRGMVKLGRAQAKQALLAHHPEILQQAIDARLKSIMDQAGGKKTTADEDTVEPAEAE